MAAIANQLKSLLSCRTYDHDPADATVATKVAWVPMGRRFLAIFKVTVGAVVTFKIFAAVDSSGTTPTLVREHSAPTAADAAGDNLVLEIDETEVQAALAGATHISVEIDMGTSTDEGSCTYIMEPRRQYKDMTADVIS